MDEVPGNRGRGGHGGRHQVGAALLGRLANEAADIDGRAAMGERRPNQRPEKKMTRTATVIVATGGAMLGLAATSARGYMRQCTSWLATENRVAGTVITPQMRCWWQPGS